MAELLLENISKLYYKKNQKIPAVKSLNLACKEREFVALLGPSGCGKSTTLRMIAGLEDITSGELIIGGKVATHLHPSKRNIGLAFEDYALYPPLSIYENIAFNLQAKGISKAEIETEVKRIANLLHITDLLDKKPSALSGGQKQRVNIARAIVRKPEVLLLDEPLSHLDGKMRQKMRAEIKHLHSEINSTTIIVTHDQSEAMALADRIAIINNGELQQFDTPNEIYNKPANEFVASFIGEPPMNIFTVSVIIENGVKFFKIIDTKIVFPISKDYQDQIDVNKVYRFGIRPHDIQIVSGNDQSTLSYKVAVFENLGEERRVYLRVNDFLISIVSNEKKEYKPNDVINLKFPEEKIHIFEKDTGERISNKI